MSIFDMFFGGGSSQSGANTALQAARMEMGAAQQGQNMLQGNLERAMQWESPYAQAGQAALQQLGGLYGLPGYSALDPTKTLEATPGYKFLLGQGTSALNRAGAASGLTGSGALGSGLVNYGQNLAQTYAWQPYIQGLTGLEQGGQAAANLIGGQLLNTAGQQANLGLQGAEAGAQGMMNALALRQQAQGLQSANLGGLAGLGIGAYGSGLFDKIGSGLSSLGSKIGGLFDMGGAFGLAAV